MKPRKATKVLLIADMPGCVYDLPSIDDDRWCHGAARVASKMYEGVYVVVIESRDTIELVSAYCKGRKVRHSSLDKIASFLGSGA